MYIVDFFKRMTRKSNIPVLIYLILNVIIICGIMYMFFGQNGDIPAWATVLWGLGLYAVSLTIALSPFGEWLLRYQNGCKKIKRVEYVEYLEPIFNEVYGRAKQMDPSLPDDIELYMNSDPSANAFATGRRTICITEGLLEMPPEQIKATLGHEFGHLAHKDTDLILVVTVGNMIVTGLILFIRVVIDIIHFILGIAAAFMGGSEGFVGIIATAVSRFLVSIFVSGLMWLWTKLGTALVMKSSRGNEFEADEFSFNLGYGDDLCALLDVIGGSAPQGLFATLVSSHPDKHDRINHLQELGSSYRATVGFQDRAGAQLPSQSQTSHIPSSSSPSQSWQPPKTKTHKQDAATKKRASSPSKELEDRKKPFGELDQMKSHVQAKAGSALKKASESAEKIKSTTAGRQQQTPSSKSVRELKVEEDRPLTRHTTPTRQPSNTLVQETDLSTEPLGRHISRGAEEAPSRKRVQRTATPVEPKVSADEFDFDIESILNEFK